MPTVALITPTGYRPEAFKLCHMYMERQTRLPDQWIIVNDGPDAERLTRVGVGVYRGPKAWKPGVNTQRPNLDYALTKVKADFVLIIEDDDWYHPTYIQQMVQLLEKWDLVGEANAKYYQLKVPGYKEQKNYSHASLCQTGFRRELIPLVDVAVNSGNVYFDIELWKLAQEKSVSSLMFTNKNLCVGIKGVPGRGGIGVGHKQKDYIFDGSLSKLRSWIGDDIKFYEPWIERGTVSGMNSFNRRS